MNPLYYPLKDAFRGRGLECEIVDKGIGNSHDDVLPTVGSRSRSPRMRAWRRSKVSWSWTLIVLSKFAQPSELHQEDCAQRASNPSHLSPTPAVKMGRIWARTRAIALGEVGDPGIEQTAAFSLSATSPRREPISEAPQNQRLWSRRSRTARAPRLGTFTTVIGRRRF